MDLFWRQLASLLGTTVLYPTLPSSITCPNMATNESCYNQHIQGY